MTLQELRDGIDAMTTAIDAVIAMLPYGGQTIRATTTGYLRDLRAERASYERALDWRINTCGEKEADRG